MHEKVAESTKSPVTSRLTKITSWMNQESLLLRIISLKSVSYHAALRQVLQGPGMIAPEDLLT